MAQINAITGLKRKRSRYETQKNKRETACSTVAGRMYTEILYGKTGSTAFFFSAYLPENKCSSFEKTQCSSSLTSRGTQVSLKVGWRTTGALPSPVRLPL